MSNQHITRYRTASASAGLWLAAIASQSTPLQTPAACTASDYATDSIAIRAEPASGAKVLKYILLPSASDLTNIDAVATRHGEWLQVRGNVTGWVPAADLSCHVRADDARRATAARSALVISALKAADYSSLAHLVHPIKGLRFSPYSSIDTSTDIVITAPRLPAFFASAAKRRWGTDDGSGKPLNLTPKQYYRKFIYSRDFVAAPDITFNAPDVLARKVWEAYPNAILSTYRFPETQSAAATSLGLVFERHHGTWYLVAIVHDGWTI